MFVGLNDTYIDSTDRRLAYTVDTKIHHVEQWGTIQENMNNELEGMRECFGKSVAEANREGAGIDVETLKSTDYYQESCAYGKNCQSQYVDWKWKNGMSFDILGVDVNRAYDIKPEEGGVLPFDYCGEGSIDLSYCCKKECQKCQCSTRGL